MLDGLKDRLLARILRRAAGGEVEQLLVRASNLHRARRLDEAAQIYREAITLAPQHHIALNNLAAVDMERGAFGAAIEGFSRALALRPDANKTRLNLAWALQVSGAVEAAIATYREVLRQDPDNRRAKSMLGMLLLWTGDFSAYSWDCYAVRKLEGQERAAGFPQPRWDGSPLRGKAILVYGHDGIGDEINFASCVPDLVAQGARVTLACNARISGLMQCSFRSVRVVDLLATADSLRAETFDFQSSLGRLNRYLRLRREDFGEGTPYLRADPVRVAAWRERLDRLGPGRKIAISWRGGNPATSGRDRSIPLEQWMRLVSLPGVHWVSLQYGDCAAELADAQAASGATIHHWQDAIDDFNECAAVATAVDNVVTVTTTLAHLCGALGKEAWVLVNARPHWRWQSSGERMPWYSSLRLFRQAGAEQWPAVLGRVAARLESETKG